MTGGFPACGSPPTRGHYGADLVDAATEVNTSATTGLTDRQVSDFMRTLSRIIDNLQTADEQPRRQPEVRRSQ
jgi:hypothetical protein